MTYRSSEDFAQETSAFRRYVYGMIRRFAITLTETARWQLLGQSGGAGGDEILSDVPAFTGIGFYARPPSSGGNPEAIGVGVGGTRTTVIIAARDEATRQAVVGDAPPDSAAMFNTKAVIVINPDGTVEIRLAGGTAVPLATKADVQALSDYLKSQFDARTGHTRLDGARQSHWPGGRIHGTGHDIERPSLAGTIVLKAE